MKRDMRVYIEDILEGIEKIEEYTKGVTGEDFYKSTQQFAKCLFLLAGDAGFPSLHSGQAHP